MNTRELVVKIDEDELYTLIETIDETKTGEIDKKEYIPFYKQLLIDGHERFLTNFTFREIKEYFPDVELEDLREKTLYKLAKENMNDIVKYMSEEQFNIFFKTFIQNLNGESVKEEAIIANNENEELDEELLTRIKEAKELEELILALLPNYEYYQLTLNTDKITKLVNSIFLFYELVLTPVRPNMSININKDVLLKINSFLYNNSIDRMFDGCNTDNIDFMKIYKVLHMYGTIPNSKEFIFESIIKKLMSNHTICEKSMNQNLAQLLIYRLYNIDLNHLLEKSSNINKIYKQLARIKYEDEEIYNLAKSYYDINIPFYLKNSFIGKHIIKID